MLRLYEICITVMQVFFIKFFLEALKMQKFKSVEELVNQLKPEKPVYCIRKHSIDSAVKFFKKKFSGKILYAVKTNPNPEVIKTIIESGVEQFDIASLEEIKSIRNLSPTAKC